ncbi:MAG: ThiF family adenylyltransferase [Rhodocyclales bacterium GT-UBC]|nr:MAG: ThiF family adenylyltransferase [Rhodocyclales bacterium GT-UBC]
MTRAFDYSLAFSRNIGWTTPDEQMLLRNKRVAIAGLGGVGGAHLLTLSRVGISQFNIADFDRFELQNFNRQAGATMSSIGQEKVNVLTSMAHEINPESTIQSFPDGVHPDNIESFLDGVDIYVDSIDFFAVETRRQLFAECYKRNIPAVTAAPLGMGAGFLYFEPGKMSFEEYFQLEGYSRQEQLIRFLAGLAPRVLQRTYLAVPDAVDLLAERGPSTIMACDICAGITGTEVLKILLNRGPRRSAPYGLQFDAYRQKLVMTWRPFGNSNPLQQLMIWLIKQQLKSKNVKKST